MTKCTTKAAAVSWTQRFKENSEICDRREERRDTGNSKIRQVTSASWERESQWRYQLFLLLSDASVSKPTLTSCSIQHVTEPPPIMSFGLDRDQGTEAVCLVLPQPAQQHPCLVQERKQDQCLLHCPVWRLRASTDGEVSARREGYAVDRVAPRQRQERDVDAEGDHGQVAVQKPADHLERLRRPRPSVYPGRLGKDQLRPTAAVHGRRASQPLTEAVHLEGTKTHIHPGLGTRYRPVGIRAGPLYAGEIELGGGFEPYEGNCSAITGLHWTKYKTYYKCEPTPFSVDDSVGLNQTLLRWWTDRGSYPSQDIAEWKQLILGQSVAQGATTLHY